MSVAGRKPIGRWCLYILKCHDGTLYTGITNDLKRRVDQHNKGTASRYTRSRLPVTVLYQERCLNKSSALKKECGIKALSRTEKEEYIYRKNHVARKAQDSARPLKKSLCCLCESRFTPG